MEDGSQVAEDVPATAPRRDESRARIIERQVKVWSGQLVDLTGRNNLLFFKELRRGTLDLTNAEPVHLHAVLAGSAVPLSRLFPDDEKADDAVKRARVIRNKAAEHYEERGLETLYIACGMATWANPRTEAVPCAPVLLCPARLNPKGSAQDEFELTMVGELEVNPTLLQLLAADFECRCDPEELLSHAGIEGAIDTPEELDLAFDWLKEKAAAVPGFAVSSRFVLGTFSYAKLPMVRDLEQSVEAMIGHELIAALAGDEGAREALNTGGHAEPIPGPDWIPPADEFLILDADASQNSVINAALAGQNLIVKGPPGTGKSQTIANLIASLVARGKKPLFVAEKRAAIDAVAKRLVACGLGDLVLDAHGGAGSRRQFALELARTLQGNGRIPEPDVGALHRTLARRRGELNDAVDAIHGLREPWGVSIYEIQARLLGMPETAAAGFELRGEALATLSGELLESAIECLDEYVTRGGLDLGSSPWGKADVRSAEEAERVAGEVTEIQTDLLPRARQLTSAGAEATGLATADEPELWSTWIELWSTACRLAEIFNADIYAADLEALAAALSPLTSSAFSRLGASIASGEFRGAKKTVRASLQPGVKLSPAELHVAVSEALTLRTRWAGLAAPDASPGFPSDLDEIGAAAATLRERLSALDKRLLHDQPSIDAGAADVDRLCTRLLDDRVTLNKLPVLHRLRDQLDRRSLGPLVEELGRRRADAGQARQALEHAWLTSVLHEAQRTDERVSSFDGAQQRRTVEGFREADREHIDSTAHRVRRICAAHAIRAMDEHRDQADLLRHQASLKRRHLPVRHLFGAAPDVLLALKPCWMMSPLVVSQLLPADRQFFDVVIFDEASQIEPADAVPAILRGKSVIVAGDSRQLPPTRFFASANPSAEEEDPDAPLIAMGADSESILEALGAFMPERMLLWHYRSRDERLIAFSNAHLYDKALTTFPGTQVAGCMRFVEVPFADGDQNSSKSSTAEVDAVVEQVLKHARDRPHESLGVIAMGIFHANRIEEALRLKRREVPELDEFFSEEREERFFIKNLERVQGDERDAIILSVGYGKGPDGRLRYNFGPLNDDGGERRLNVAVTRAKKRMTVVSSLTALDLDPERTTREGLRLLRHYLEYAHSGGTNLGEGASERPELNGFEIDVRDSLDRVGIPLIPQWGCSGYFIDFAAKHPTRPGELVLAIEADGATYHSSQSARDRDRLRQDHLENLGWNFHRIWSTDWFRNKAREIELAQHAYAAAVRAADESDDEAASVDLTPADAAAVAPAGRAVPFPAVRTGLSIGEYRLDQLIAVVRHVQSDTLLRTRDELVAEVMRALGFKRKGSRIVAAIEQAIDATQV